MTRPLPEEGSPVVPLENRGANPRAPRAVSRQAADSSGQGDGGAPAGNDAGTGGAGGAPAACGYHGQGRVLDVGTDIELCLPPAVCNPETCPPSFADCVNGACVFKGGYKGLETLPEAWATQYCSLAAQACHGVSQLEFPRSPPRRSERRPATPCAETLRLARRNASASWPPRRWSSATARRRSIRPRRSAWTFGGSA